MSLRLTTSKIARTCNPVLYSSQGKTSFRHFATVEPEIESAAGEKKEVDPMEVFDQIDTNGDGVLSKEEFKTAVDKMNYTDLLKIKNSLARNELSYNPTADEASLLSTSHASVIGRRIIVTAEVAVSKIFPAGFGWQSAASFAEGAGMQANDLSFFLTTGLGDGLGVFLGHTAYMVGKKAVTGDESIDVTAQAQTGFFLGSAAFCSGSVWQPVVNALQALGWDFNTSVAATGGACALAFFSGLRLGRMAYGKIFRGVENGNYANLKADAALSVSVGGATGCFLGTDVSYDAANWMRPGIGIEEAHSAVSASSLAGTSTLIGFTTVQMGENLIYPKDKCWVD